MANRKQTPGIIGLGSRLFVGKETAWGTAVIDIDPGGAEGQFQQYYLYNNLLEQNHKKYLIYYIFLSEFFLLMVTFL